MTKPAAKLDRNARPNSFLAISRIGEHKNPFGTDQHGLPQRGHNKYLFLLTGGRFASLRLSQIGFDLGQAIFQDLSQLLILAVMVLENLQASGSPIKRLHLIS